jgi:hypothetical protein
VQANKMWQREARRSSRLGIWTGVGEIIVVGLTSIP